MRVLHITTGLGNGGAEAVLFGLVTAATGDVHEIVSLTDEGYYGERLRDAGIAVHALRMPAGKVTPAAVLELYRLIRAAQPDKVQTWMYHANLLGGLLSRLSGARVSWSIHHSDLDATKTPLGTRLVARACAALSSFVPERIVYCSAKAADVHASLGYDARRAVLVDNGVDVQRFVPDAEARARIRAQWGIAEGQLLLGMVARWDPLKDHETLLGALAHAELRLPHDYRLALVGPGMDSSNTELEALVARFGLQQHVRLVGAQADVPAIMNALDLHVLSSCGEAFGNVSIEAMACAVPAIVTAAGAGAHIVGATGWVVPVRSPQALAESILAAIQAMASPDEWRARKAACRARIVEQFNLARMVAGYRKVWQHGAPRSAPPR